MNGQNDGQGLIFSVAEAMAKPSRERALAIAYNWLS
jgi:hypothetical protein